MSIRGRVGQIWTKNGSKIMTGAGVVGSLVAMGLVVYKSVTKAPKIVEQAKEELEEVRDREVTEEYTQKDKGKDTAKVYLRAGMAFAKLYGVAFIIEVTSIGLIVGSDVKDYKRNVYLSSSLMAAEKTIDTIKTNTIDRFGEDVYYELEHGIKKQEITEEEVNPETGKTKQVKKTIEVADPNHSASTTKYFTKTNPYWDELTGEGGKMNEAYLENFFSARLGELTDKLRAKKDSIKDPNVTQNDAFEAYGFPRENHAYGNCWIYDEKHGVTVVDIFWHKVHIRNEDMEFEEAYAIDFHPTHNTFTGELLTA